MYSAVGLMWVTGDWFQGVIRGFGLVILVR
jgi:hypothetical protein